MKSLFEFILSAIDAGHLIPLEPQNDARFFKLKRVATQENFPSLKEDGFIKKFIYFVQILQLVSDRQAGDRGSRAGVGGEVRVVRDRPAEAEF